VGIHRRRLIGWGGVGTYLAGIAKEIAEQATIHHLLFATCELNTPE
jgi:hypothetical protein